MNTPDLQKTIEELEYKAHILSEPAQAEFFYPTLANYLLIETANAINNAITLLKAQQKRIGMLEEGLKLISCDADRILSEIIADIRSRSGLGDVWKEIDFDVLNEIISEWRAIINDRSQTEDRE